MRSGDTDGGVPSLQVRALTRDDAVRIAGWRYDGPWAVYDVADSQILVGELDHYSAIVDASDVLHGFFCVGPAARVPGLEPDPRYVDIGIGLDPAIVGIGRGAAVGRLVMRHLGSDQRLRAVVQSWNERSLRLARRLGFSETGVREAGGVLYAVLVTPDGGRTDPLPRDTARERR